MDVLKISPFFSNRWVAGFLTLLPIGLIVLCIAHYGVNVPFADDWDLSSLVSKAAQHKVQLRHLLQQHNEHRIFFLKLVVVVQAWTSHWNLQLQMLLSVVLCSITMGNLLLLIRRTVSASIETGLAVRFFTAVLLFSPVQYENWLWGFQCAFFIPPLCLTASWALLTSSLRLAAKYWLTALLTTVATFSFSTGAFGWALTFPLFLLTENVIGRRRKTRLLCYWLAMGCVCMGAYFLHYHQPAHSTSILTGFHPFLYAEYAMIFLGGSLFRTALDQSTTVPFVTGLGLGVLYLVSAGYVFKPATSAELRQRSMPWIAFGGFAVAGAVLCALGRRAYLPARQALDSRYTTVSLILVVTLIPLFVIVGRDLKARLGGRVAQGLSWLAGVGSVVLGAGYAVSLPFCFEQMATLRAYHLDGKAALQYCLALRDPGVAEAIMTATLYPNLQSLRGFVAMLQPTGVFRPALVTHPRLEANARSRDPERAHGRLDSFRVVDNRYVIEGWAVLPDRNEGADGIVVASSNATGEWIALTMAGERNDRPDVDGIAGTRSLKKIGWKATFPISIVPSDARELSAWAIDATNGNSYQLDGFYSIPVTPGAGQ